MSYSVELNERDAKFIQNYADAHNIDVPELIRQLLVEKIEDEYDLRCYKKAMREFEKNPVTYSHEEMKKMVGLT